MATPTRESRPSQIECRELLRELLQQLVESVQGIEDFPMATGVRTATVDDVRPIGPMSTARVKELSRFLNSIGSSC